MQTFPFAAVLFDMDGTLVDNVPLHQAVWKEFTIRHGLHLSDRELAIAIGRKATETVKHFWPDATPHQVNELVSERQVLYRARLVDSSHVRPVPGVEAFLAYLGEVHIPRVLATSAPRENVDAVFRRFGFGPAFERIVTSEQIKHGKPDPEIYLEAARVAEAPAERCLVAEDSLAGVAAAKAAGCTCFAVTTTESEADLRRTGADYVAADFRNLPDALTNPSAAQIGR